MLMEQAKMHGGMQALKTVGGGTLTVVMDGMKLALKDEKGGMATITIPDVMQSNGVIHVIRRSRCRSRRSRCGRRYSYVGMMALALSSAVPAGAQT